MWFPNSDPNFALLLRRVLPLYALKSRFQKDWRRKSSSSSSSSPSFEFLSQERYNTTSERFKAKKRIKCFIINTVVVHRQCTRLSRTVLFARVNAQYGEKVFAHLSLSLWKRKGPHHHSSVGGGTKQRVWYLDRGVVKVALFFYRRTKYLPFFWEYKPLDEYKVLMMDLSSSTTF